MSDFIILKCENCGAQLRIEEERDVFFCDHCGYKHILKKSASSSIDESYASCPLCKRNDKARKISTYGITYKKRQCPQKSNYFRTASKKKIPTCSILIFAYGALGLLVITEFFKDINFRPVAPWFLILFILCFFGAGSYLLSTFKDNKQKSLENKKIESENEIAAQRYEKDKAYFEAINPLYDKIAKLWEELYYCERDDIIYLRGTRGFDSRDNAAAYIEKIALEKK